MIMRLAWLQFAKGSSAKYFADRVRANFHRLGVTAFALSLITLCIAVRYAHADVYRYEGTPTPIHKSGSDLNSPYYDGFSTNQEGSFTDPDVWGYPGSSLVGGGFGYVHTVAPGANDTVFVQGFPAGYDTLVNGPTRIADNGDTIGGYFGEFTGPGGFQVTNTSGTVATLSVSGPGSTSMAGLTVTGVTSFDSVGGIGLLQIVPNLPIGSPDLFQFGGFAPSVQTITGGTLSTPTLYLAAGTDLAPATIEGFPLTSLPDPVADAGSLNISGVTSQRTGASKSKIFTPKGGRFHVYNNSSGCRVPVSLRAIWV